MTVEQVMLDVLMPLLFGGVVLAFLRLCLGPTLADRVVSLDMMGTLAIGIMATYAVGTGQAVVLDVAVVIALILFLGTVAFAYYLERRVRS